MEKISLQNMSSFEGAPLSRTQLKKVTGGFSSSSACKNSQGGCDLAVNCQRPGGAAGKCDLQNSVCGCF
ncbi:hypothetical protein HDE69_001779 [Pedobacter cryoconitis]|uniref:Uncharacterized protein n=1 Tax=Pedobacter cryoconitis TaxID=188932 RepID=A0A7W8YSK9_9SPHI|nr:hypothetical protein [Pedobacter cryoconitis]MBB5620730.1 hypothetical protein [Pedobacter cryoconitis]